MQRWETQLTSKRVPACCPGCFASLGFFAGMLHLLPLPGEFHFHFHFQVSLPGIQHPCWALLASPGHGRHTLQPFPLTTPGEEPTVSPTAAVLLSSFSLSLGTSPPQKSLELAGMMDNCDDGQHC